MTLRVIDYALRLTVYCFTIENIDHCYYCVGQTRYASERSIMIVRGSNVGKAQNDRRTHNALRCTRRVSTHDSNVTRNRIQFKRFRTFCVDIC